MPFENLSRELIAASSEAIILSILNQGESYGYAIIQKVRLCSQERIKWTDGMLYPVLHRMESKSLIKSKWADGEGGPRREFYRITVKGGKFLIRHEEDWTAVTQTLQTLRNVCLT